jgi:hypothetical protein
MGQAKRRKQQLGAAYGTPEGSNRPLVVYQGFDQPELDRKSLAQIRAAQAAGQPVILMGTFESRPLAAAAGLPWLHELPPGEPLPRSLAWDPTIAERTGLMLPPGHGDGAVMVMGAGCGQWLKAAASGRPALPTPTLADLPAGARQRTMKQLAGMIGPDALQEVEALLATGPMDWERAYSPLPAFAAQASKVLVAGVGGFLRVGCMPPA